MCWLLFLQLLWLPLNLRALPSLFHTISYHRLTYISSSETSWFLLVSNWTAFFSSHFKEFFALITVITSSLNIFCCSLISPNFSRKISSEISWTDSLCKGPSIPEDISSIRYFWTAIIFHVGAAEIGTRKIWGFRTIRNGIKLYRKWRIQWKKQPRWNRLLLAFYPLQKFLP